MRTFSGRRSTLVLAITGVTVVSGSMAMSEARAEGFIDGSTLTGSTYYWQHEHDHKDATDGDKCKTNLSHSTRNANLDFQPGYAVNMFGPDIAAFAVIEMVENGDNSHLSEIVFSKSNKTHDGDWSGDKSGISPYRAAAEFKYGPVWTRADYIQPIGQTLLAPHWSFMPGTYQGVRVGASFDHGDAGALSLSYMWINEYKTPWHLETNGFYQNGGTTKVDYLHFLGAKYGFKNNSVLKAAFDQAEGYIDQCFAETNYKFGITGNPLTTNYQFYDIRDKVDDRSINDLYDGTAWLQALTFGCRAADAVDLRLEGTWVKTDSQQGYFLQRMTPTYASLNGHLDIWWDNRSDSDANGEGAAFSSTMYDLKNWNLPGFATSASYIYTQDAKPTTWQSNPDTYYDENRTIKESIYSLGAAYAVQDGCTKGTVFKLHFIEYDNHSDIPSRGGGYDNIFQGERDVKLMVIVPFTIF